MKALPENIARGQSNDWAREVVADQGQYFQVKPELRTYYIDRLRANQNTLIPLIFAHQGARKLKD